MALKNLSSEKRGRWRLSKCYAQEHIIVDFPFILKSLNVWISSKKNIYIRVIWRWNVMIIFKNRRNCTLRLSYIAIMSKNWHIVQGITYCAIQQIKKQFIEWIITVSTLLIIWQPCAGHKILRWGHSNISWWWIFSNG